jgi:hypothetical protein
VNTIKLLLYIAALVLLLFAAFGPTVRRVSLGWLGMACWLTAAVIVDQLH